MRCGGDRLSCDSVSIGLSQGKAERWWRSGGGCCCCWWWWFGCSHWFVSLLCLSLSPLHLNPARSLHFTSHYTHMHAHTHIETHTCTPRFGKITQSWGTKGSRRQIVSSPEQSQNSHKQHSRPASISKLPKTLHSCQLLTNHVSKSLTNTCFFIIHLNNEKPLISRINDYSLEWPQRLCWY